MKLLLRRSVHHSVHSAAIFCSIIFIAIISTSFTLYPVTAPHEKILTVKLNSSGIISVGRDTIVADELARYIQERLFKSYSGTGKMFDTIKLLQDGEPDTGIKEKVIKEIAAGQKRALNELCLEKHKQLFDDIRKGQQEKLRKKFPVLFQTNYD